MWKRLLQSEKRLVKHSVHTVAFVWTLSCMYHTHPAECNTILPVTDQFRSNACRLGPVSVAVPPFDTWKAANVAVQHGGGVFWKGVVRLWSRLPNFIEGDAVPCDFQRIITRDRWQNYSKPYNNVKMFIRITNLLTRPFSLWKSVFKQP